MDQEEIRQTIKAMAAAMAPMRTPVYRRPDEYGLEYEDIFFNAIDGTRLEGWYIPAASDRLIICNHFGPGNRYGFAGHLPEFSFAGGFEVNFLPAYKALHEAGYNIIAYDIRDHGLSATSGTNGFSVLEWRDAVGAVRYAKSRRDTVSMKTGLHTMCLGCNSTVLAIDKMPAEFEHIVCMTAMQPVIGSAMIKSNCRAAGIDEEEGLRLYDEERRKILGYRVADYDITDLFANLTMPTLMLQVRDDPSMKTEAIEAAYERLPHQNKKLVWVEDTNLRFKGYSYFSENTDELVGWFDQHMIL